MEEQNPVVEASLVEVVEAVYDVEQFVEESHTITEEDELKPMIASILYVTEGPMTVADIAKGLGREPALVEKLIGELIELYEKVEHGFQIHSKAGGYYFGTKPEYDEALRQFVVSDHRESIALEAARELPDKGLWVAGCEFVTDRGNGIRHVGALCRALPGRA